MPNTQKHFESLDSPKTVGSLKILSETEGYVYFQ